MQYVKGISAYQNQRPTAITLGKFDGLHQGHELLIERVIQHQKEDDVDGVVLAFDMRPLFQKLNKEMQFILTSEEKARRLEGRVSYFIDCPFDETISSMEAETFIEKVLVERFHVKYVVVGTDFRFGHEKRGDHQMLREYGKKFGFEVEVFEKKQHEGREISSTYIKEELKKGHLELANQLLGYDYVKNAKKHFDNE